MAGLLPFKVDIVLGVFELVLEKVEATCSVQREVSGKNSEYEALGDSRAMISE